MTKLLSVEKEQFKNMIVVGDLWKCISKCSPYCYPKDLNLSIYDFVNLKFSESDIEKFQEVKKDEIIMITNIHITDEYRDCFVEFFVFEQNCVLRLQNFMIDFESINEQ